LGLALILGILWALHGLRGTHKSSGFMAANRG
jgi:hypothetical protein